MERISLPQNIKIQPSKDNPNQVKVVIEAFYPGYGATIGNSLRRVLLSSIEGAAVTKAKIKGASHEYNTLPNIKEEVLEILLNLKKLRLQLLSDEPQKLILQAKGSKMVVAGDIKKNAQVEIINKDLLIATLTSKSAELALEFWVEKGRGYLPVEEKERETELGVMAVDSIFSPVLKVGYSVESARVGKRTDFDKLILEITTDGTITVEDALKQALNILIEQFKHLESNISPKKSAVKK